MRLQLLLVPLPMLALIGVAASRGGLWLALLVPSALVLVVHARIVVACGLRSWNAALGNLALVLGMCAFFVFAVGPALGLYRTVTVLSGSMRPTFSPGDVIFVRSEPATRLRVGDVISYQIPVDGQPVETHRVVRILEHGREPIVQTEGDANSTVDPWTAKLHGGTIWTYAFRLPLLGYPLLALRTPQTHRLLVLGLPALLALYLLAQVWLPRATRLQHA